MKLIPTILCGGAGSRLWPISREYHPKPFIRLNDGQSLLQKAFIRAALLSGVNEVLTVTNRELFFKTEDDYREVNNNGTVTSFILEPFGKNTAAAIAAAALDISARHGHDAIMLVLAADHLIGDQQAFAEAVEQASKLAMAGKLVTFGIRPESPETGYGYIEADGSIVLQFVEKPSLQKAKEYINSGRFYWNSGMFCFAAGEMLKQIQQHSPEILRTVSDCLKKSRIVTGAQFLQTELDSDSFASVPENSIDYAVMEASDNIAVVPCSIGWSDIGSWSAMGNLVEPDESGNRVLADALLHDVKNCYIQGSSRFIGAVGVADLIVVDTPDALLVANRAHAQDVKHIYAELKASGHEAHKIHSTVSRPWGTYTVLENGDRFKIKRIVVKPNASLSLQMHQHRSEHWVVIRGTAHVQNGDENIIIYANESTYIPAGRKHRLENRGDEDLVIIEVQCGSYVGEDDIERFEDSYGRC